ncbi:MAG: hypothetical protein EOO12_13770, partial [Chitinophagaceae bacterium]
MSSKYPAYHPLTRANYEEAFLLYVDGELSPEAMDAVDAFVALHPDLHEELQALLDTRLDAEPLTLGNLDFLQAPQMRHLSREEELLSYIDNELGDADRAALERDLSADPALRAELAAYHAARLPADAVACPFKEELYRREEKRRPLLWLPRVAAAVLLLGAGAALWQSNRSGTGSTGDASGASVAQRTEPAHAASTPAFTAPDAETKPTETTGQPALAAATPAKTHKANRISTGIAIPLPAVKGGLPPKERGYAQPGDQKEAIAYNYTPDPRDRTPEQRNALPGSGDTHPSVNPTLANPGVTSASTAALNNQKADAQPTATEAVYREEGRQNSVRGFLR